MKRETKKTVLLWGLAMLAVIAILLLLTLSKRVTPAYDAQALLEQGTEYLREGDFRQAKTCFDELVRTAPELPDGYLGSAQASIGLEKPDDAQKTLEKGLKKLPDDSALAALLANLDSSPRSE